MNQIFKIFNNNTDEVIFNFQHTIKQSTKCSAFAEHLYLIFLFFMGKMSNRSYTLLFHLKLGLKIS